MEFMGRSKWSFESRSREAEMREVDVDAADPPITIEDLYRATSRASFYACTCRNACIIQCKCMHICGVYICIYVCIHVCIHVLYV